MAKPLTCFLLTISEGDRVEQRVIDESKFTIGRAIEATLAFSDPNMSRLHLIVRAKGEKITIEDKESANGTFLGHQRLDANVQVEISPTDTITFGKSEIQIKMQLVERNFPKDATKNPALNAQGQKLMMELLEGAHAEAARITTHAQDQIAQLQVIAKEKADKLIADAEAERDALIARGNEHAEELIADGRKKVARIIQSAEIDAEDMRRSLEEDLTAEKIKRLSQIDQEAAAEIEENRQKARDTLDLAEQKASEIVATANSKAIEILKSNQEKSDKILADADHLVEEKVALALAEAKLKAEKEREELLRLARQEADQDLSRRLRDQQFSWEKEKSDKVKEFEEDFTKRTELLEAEITAKRIVFEKDEADRRALVSKHSTEIADLYKTLDVLRSDKDRLEPLVITIKADLAAATAECERQKNAYQEYLAKSNAEDERYKRLSEDFSKVTEQLASRRAEIERSQEIEKAHIQRLRDLDQQMHTAEKSLDEVKDRLAKVQDEYKKKSYEIEEVLKFEKERMAKEKDSYALAVQLEHEKQKRNFESQLEKIKKEVETQSQEFQSLKENSYKKQAELTQVETSLRVLTPQFEQMREELSNYDSKKSGLEASIRQAEEKHQELQTHIENGGAHFKKLQSEVDRAQDQLRNLKHEISVSLELNQNISAEFKKLVAERDAYKAENIKMFTDKDYLSKEIASLSSRSEELKKTVGNLEFQLGDKTAQLQNIEREYQVQLGEFKTKLEDDQRRMQREQSALTDEMKLVEVNRISRLQEDMLVELSSRKETIIKEAHRQVELELAKMIDRSAVSAVSQQLHTAIRSAFEESTASIVTQGLSSSANPTSLKAKKRRERVAMMAMGIVLGLGVMPVYQLVEKQVNASSYKQVVDDKIKKEKEEYEARRFNPPKVDELQSSYTDSVIYTEKFVEKLLDDGYQKRFNTAVIDYFLDKWRVEEEVSIRATSVVYSLISTLEERRKNIHPDFVEENVAKMRELEEGSAKRLEEILGSKVKVEAFKKFEKRFFEQEASERIPASNEEK